MFKGNNLNKTYFWFCFGFFCSSLGIFSGFLGCSLDTFVAKSFIIHASLDTAFCCIKSIVLGVSTRQRSGYRNFHLQRVRNHWQMPSKETLAPAIKKPLGQSGRSRAITREFLSIYKLVQALIFRHRIHYQAHPQMSFVMAYSAGWISM